MENDDLVTFDVEEDSILVLVEGRPYLVEPATKSADQRPSEWPPFLYQSDIPSDLPARGATESLKPLSYRRRSPWRSIEAKSQSAWRRFIFAHLQKVYYS